MSEFANTASKPLLAWALLAGLVCAGGTGSPVLAAEGAAVPEFRPRQQHLLGAGPPDRR